MEENRLSSCCFTGHRPEKLQESEDKICERLRVQIEAALEDGFRTFISGMAPGVDILAAEIILNIKKERPDVSLICAVPFPGFVKSRTGEWRSRFERIIKEADTVHFVTDRYMRACFLLRDKWMVDHANRVIAVYNGTPGGTEKTIHYAEKIGIPVVMA